MVVTIGKFKAYIAWNVVLAVTTAGKIFIAKDMVQYIVMAYVVVACIVMAYTVMARNEAPWSAVCHRQVPRGGATAFCGTI